MTFSTKLLMWFVFLLSNLKASVTAYSDGYIGCYTQSAYMTTTLIKGNNGSVCKQHCFPHHRYAGTRLDHCYCGLTLGDDKLNVSKCSYSCPGQPYNRKCGGVSGLTIYDINRIEPKFEAEPSIVSYNIQHVTRNNVRNSLTMESHRLSSLASESLPLGGQRLSTIKTLIVKEESPLCIIASSSIAFGLLVLLIMVLAVYRCTSTARCNRGPRNRNGGYITPTPCNNTRVSNDVRANQTAIHMNTMNRSILERTYI